MFGCFRKASWMDRTKERTMNRTTNRTMDPQIWLEITLWRPHQTILTHIDTFSHSPLAAFSLGQTYWATPEPLELGVNTKIIGCFRKENPYPSCLSSKDLQIFVIICDKKPLRASHTFIEKVAWDAQTWSSDPFCSRSKVHNDQNLTCTSWNLVNRDITYLQKIYICERYKYR